MADLRLIDANALRLMKVAKCAGHTIEFAAGWKACVEYCKNDAPTIEAKPVKHGRWMYPFYCSECGFTPYYSSDLTYNYCPNCGARMEDDHDQP